MATIVRALETTCTLDYYGEHHWTCEGPAAGLMQQSLNAHLQYFDPGGHDPNPPYTHAQEMANLYSGEVLDFDEVPFDPNAIY